MNNFFIVGGEGLEPPKSEDATSTAWSNCRYANRLFILRSQRDEKCTAGSPAQLDWFAASHASSKLTGAAWISTGTPWYVASRWCWSKTSSPPTAMGKNDKIAQKIRLSAVQDLAWALANGSAFLFNR